MDTFFVLLVLSLLQSLVLASALYAVSVLAERFRPGLGSASAFGFLAAAGVLAFVLIQAIPASTTVVNLLVWGASFAGLLACVFTRSWNPDAAISAGLLVVSTVVLVLWAFGPVGANDMIPKAATRWSHQLPVDNAIPLFFAEGLAAGVIQSPLVGDWLSSDRPPLQSSLYLLFRIPSWDHYQTYQVLSMSFQLLAVPSSYLLLRHIGLSRRVAAMGALIALFTPLSLVNSLFVWPKMLSAAMLAIAAVIHFTPAYHEHRSSGLAGAIVGATSAGAMLAHGGAAFALIGFAVAALSTKRLATLRYSAAALLVFTVLYAPWVHYQRYVDPPGDRLIKWHLAGVETAGDNRSPLTAIMDAYSGMSPSEFAARQLDKMGNIFSNPFDFYSALRIIPENRGPYRDSVFFNALPSLGVFGVIAAFGFPFAFRDREIRPLAVAVALSLMVWIFSIYDPQGAIVHHSSYFIWIGLTLCSFAVFARLKREKTILAIAIGHAAGSVAYLL